MSAQESPANLSLSDVGWAARCLEEAGYEVIVADANSAPLSAQHRHRAKTDRHDAEVLVHASRFGAYPPTHRTAKRWRHVQTVMSVRKAFGRPSAVEQCGTGAGETARLSPTQ